MPTNTRKMCRSGQHCEPRSLAEAVDCVAHHSEIPLREIAERIGKSESYLRTACSQYDDTHHFQADLIVPVTLVTGNPTILRFLARQVGGEFVALPTGLEGTAPEALRAATAVREFGQLLESFSTALGDGQVNEAEAMSIAREGHDVIEAVLALMEFARAAAIASGPPSPPHLRRVS